MKKIIEKILKFKMLGLIVILLTCVFFILKSTVFSNENIKSNSKQYILNTYIDDIEQKVKENQQSTIKEEIKIEIIDIDYRTYYRPNNNMLKGTSNVLQEGKDGKKEIVSKIKYKNNIQSSKNIISSRIIEKSQNQIIEIGTAEEVNISKKNLQMIVNSNELVVRQEAGVSSKKIATLKKGDKVQVTNQINIWSKIKTESIQGWVLTDDLSKYSENSITLSGISQIKFDMNIYKPSGLTYDQFIKVLSENSKDKNKIIESNAQFFYYAEKQYKINGIFLAAVAIHESNWGTSKISSDKKNLFGYGANDASPYENAKEFSSYSEGIDLLARVFVKYYLSPSGSYYNGTTLEGINTRYATDKQWANKVYSHMQYLYNRI